MLNWIIATADEYATANITPPVTARRWMIDTPTGTQEVILQHVDIHADNFEMAVRKIPSGCFVSDTTLQYLLPIEEVDNGTTNV